jgi:RHS repeat-associated protein
MTYIDDNNVVLGSTIEDRETVTYTYNRGGQVQTVTGYKPARPGENDCSFPYVRDIGYDEFGQRVFIEYGGGHDMNKGVATVYDYNPERRWLDRIITTNPNGRTYQDIKYHINEVGNVNGYENENYLGKTNQHYTYDDLYQLLTARGDSWGYDRGDLGAVNYHTNYSQTFAFDTIGNMKSKVSTQTNFIGNNGQNINYSNTYTRTAGYAHRMDKIGDIYYRYDGNGNVISARQGAPAEAGPGALVNEEDGVYSTDYGFALYSDTASTRPVTQTNYTWNERNLMTRSESSRHDVQYRYGADGQRAIKYTVNTSSETLYFNNNIFVTLNQNGWIENKNIFLGDTRIATKRRRGDNNNYGQEQVEEYFYHGDHLGNVQLVTDYQGEVYEHFEYTPYGELFVDDKARTDSTPFRFTGKELDEETGLIYFGARYLNPQTSMWMSADPAMGEYVPQAPINDDARKSNGNLPGMGGVFNAVNLHVFAYAGNNPIRYTDPTGRDFEGLLQHKKDLEEKRLQRIEDIKTGKIGTFTQQQWTEELGFESNFFRSACCATSLLNGVARAYAMETGKEMTVERGASILLSAVNEGYIRKDNARVVKLMADTLAYMAGKAGIKGRMVYNDEGSNSMWKIYVFHKGYYDEEEKQEKVHFVNSSGVDQFFDVWDGSIKNRSTETPANTRSIRGIDYYLSQRLERNQR